MRAFYTARHEINTCIGVIYIYLNSQRSVYENSNKTPRLSGHFSIFSLVFFVLKSFLGTARQWSREKFAIFSQRPRSHVRISICRTWAISIFCKLDFAMRCMKALKS